MQKRHFSIQSVLCPLLVMLSCAALLAGCAKGESIPGITYADIANANRSSVLLKNHTSVKAITTESGDSVTSISYYVDSNTYAIDYGDYQLVYTPEIQGTLGKGVFNPMLNLSGEEFYQQQRDYFLLAPLETESVTDCVRTGDTLTVTTALSAQEARPTIEAILGKAEEKDSLSAEYCIDAYSYSLQSYTLYLCSEGEERRQIDSIDKVVYDEAAPSFVTEALALAAAPQALAEDGTRTVSVVMNPNTSDEETISATVAKGAGVSFVRREGYNTFYLDRACTKIYKEGTADKNEDLTLYCIPDKEPAPFTAEQAEQINTVDHLLKSYQTITYAQLDYIGGYTMHVMHFLNEADEVCSIEDDSGYSAYRNNAFLLERENGETYYHIYGEAEHTGHLLMVANSEFTSQEANENGDLLCEMTADIDEDYADALSNWSVTTEDKMLTTVVFAASDHRVLTIDYVIAHPDGTKLKIASGVTLYDQELQSPDMLWDYAEAEKATVTVTLADGSTRTAQIPKQTVRKP